MKIGTWIKIIKVETKLNKIKRINYKLLNKAIKKKLVIIR